MPRPVKLTPHICDLIALHNIRNALPEEITPFFDYYIEELSGNTLHTHIDNGVVYYSRKSTPLLWH